MALTRQFFQTPTGTTYQPAKDIERSFDKTSMLLGGMMQRESERLQREEAAFSELYNNIGELESTLMQNYAGIEQQAIQSTRDFVKEHLKKGGRVNDPEFQLSLGERTGRIKAAMSNAERNREALKAAAETIKNDPAILDKSTAMTSLMSRMNDPDFLISKNPFDVESFLDGFVNPNAVFREAVKSLPTEGEFTDEFYDEKGNLVSRTLLTNPLVSRENPFDESGRPNVVISDEFARSVAEGQMGNRVLQQVNKIAQERYGDLPRDVAFKEALRDGMGSVMGMNLKQGIKKSAIDIQREQEADRRAQDQLELARENRETDLEYKRELRLAGLEEADAKTKNLYQQFLEDVNTGSTNYLSKMFIPNTVEGIDLVTERQRKMAEYGIPDHKAWTKLTPERRIEILNENNIEVPTRGWWTVSDKKEAYDALIEKINTSPESNNIVGVTMKVKEGTDKGSSIFKPRNFIWGDDPTKLPAMFEQFENIRKKAKGSDKPSPEPPSPKTPSGFKNVPDGGFN